MNETFTLSVRVVQDANVCLVTMETPGFEHILGSSKRHPADKGDPIIGQCVAFGRLFQTLSGHYDSIVEALKKPVEVEEPAEMDVAEEAWFAKFQVPPEKMMGDNQQKEKT